MLIDKKAMLCSRNLEFNQILKSACAEIEANLKRERLFC
jgi:hypothetical protein